MGRGRSICDYCGERFNKSLTHACFYELTGKNIPGYVSDLCMWCVIREYEAYEGVDLKKDSEWQYMKDLFD